MAIDLEVEDGGKLLVCRLSGKLEKKDYEHFGPAVAREITAQGKVRMLVDMHDFHGWTAGALWEDVKFDVKHFNHFERLAIIGDKTWEKWMASFCKPFTTASVKYFPQGHESEARAWLTAA